MPERSSAFLSTGRAQRGLTPRARRCMMRAARRAGRMRERLSTMPTPILEVDDVRKNYGTQEALKGVSFCVMDGDMFGLLGPNGAGKTTLLSIISTLLEASAGEVRLLGKK